MTLSPVDFRTPGQFIKALLDEKEWSQTVAAIVMGVDQSLVSGVLAGKRRVDATLALKLGEVFEMDPSTFLDLQKNYDLGQALLVERPDPRRSTRARLFGGLPIAEMITRGWLAADNIRDVPKVEVALARFFGVPTADEIEILPHAAKKTHVDGTVTPSQLAWLYRTRQIAEEMMVARYSPSAVRAAITKLSGLLLSVDEARHVPRILAEAGVRFVIVESIASAKIDGACFWLNDMAPVVAMSLRFDRVDNFWFVLRHELEHVLRGHGRKAIAIDTELDGPGGGTDAALSEDERVANEAAAEFCVPRDMMEKFYVRKSPLFTERDVIGFAAMIRVHPGLVAGQLQRRTQQYDRFRKHLVKVRSTVTPSAAVDGWGDVFPVHYEEQSR